MTDKEKRAKVNGDLLAFPQTPPAYPFVGLATDGVIPDFVPGLGAAIGMTKRELMARDAMKGILSGHGVSETAQACAEAATRHADALLLALEGDDD